MKDADKVVLRMLTEDGKVWERKVVEHPYPHCWRCSSPLLYYARDSWYLKTTDFLTVGWRMAVVSVAVMLLAASFYWPLLES